MNSLANSPVQSIRWARDSPQGYKENRPESGVWMPRAFAWARLREAKEWGEHAEGLQRHAEGLQWRHPWMQAFARLCAAIQVAGRSGVPVASVRKGGGAPAPECLLASRRKHAMLGVRWFKT